MKYPKLEEILNQYEFESKKGSAQSIFEKYKDWFTITLGNGELKALLLDNLKDVARTKDLKKYDFVLLIIQAFDINFTENDEHFELIFSIADSLTEDYTTNVKGDKTSWLLWQLTDICIHHSDELDRVSKINPQLIPRVVRKIGKIKYEIRHGNSMEFAALKSVSLVWYMSDEEAKEILQEVFLKHFDAGVIEEAKEIIEHLKEEKRYE